MENNKLSARSLLLILVAGFGYQVLNGSAFLINSYYTLFANGMQLTNTQVGTCMTMVGIVTTFGYLFGGILGDIFPTRLLMIVSHGGVATCLFIMMTLPGYKELLILEFFLGFFAIGTYWGAMTRFIKSLGSPAMEGKLYGLFYGCCGLSGSVIGFIVAGIVAHSGDVTGLRSLLMLFAGVNILAAVVIFLFYRGYKPIADDSEKFRLSDLIEVLKMPDVWIVGCITLCAEMIYSVMAYVAPMLQDSFAVSAAVITIVVTIRVHCCRLITSPVSGVLVDKLKSPLRVLKYAMIASVIIVGIITVMPWKPAFAAIAIIAVILMAILFNLSTTCWFTTVTEIGVPERVRATAVGLACAITFSGDMWTYAVGGKLVDKFGDMGYRYYFIMCLVFFVIGLILIRVAQNRIKKRQAAAQ